MVGRTEEAAYLATVISDPAQFGVVVSGSAGVGKTRLIREAVESAQNCHVEFVTATDSARSLPFGAFAHLLPEQLQTIDRVDLLAVIGRHLVRRARGSPILLAVDDMHLLDSLSAALVHHVVTAGEATVLLTLRSGEPAPDAVTGLYRDEIVSRLELQPISRVEFDELIEGALGGLTEGRTLDRMWEVTDGNVLFARQLVDDALGAGTLSQEHGVWRWKGGLGVALRLKETVAARLGSLVGPERRLLELLAVGEPLSFADAEHLAPTVSIEDLERRSLLAVEGNGGVMMVRLAHPLLGEVLRAGMNPSLHRKINHDLAEAIAGAVEPQPGDAIKLALLREAAGEAGDPKLLADAARNANLLLDHGLAERLASASIAGGNSFNAEFELARALTGQQRFEDAQVVLTRLVGAEPDDPARERLADSILEVVGYDLGRVDEALEVAEVLEQSVTDPTVRALMQCHRATLLAFAARFGDAADLGMVALRSVDDESIRIRSLSSVGISLVMSGRIDEALALGEGALDVALRLQDRLPRAPLWAVMSRCTALQFAGRAREAIEALDLAHGILAGFSTFRVAQANAYRGRFLLSQGRARTARRFLIDAAVALRETPHVEPSWCVALIAEANALLGQHEEAREAATEAASLRRRNIAAFEADELRALSWVDAQAGHTSSAIEQLWAAADLAKSRGQRTFELIILEDLLRLGEYAAAQRSLELADHVDGGWSAAIASHAKAALSADPVDLEIAAEAFSQIGCSLVAAELWAAASAALQGEGLRARAAEASRHSVKLAESCEGARTEPLGWAGARVPLSRRERETAKLAANGATNAQIAADLSISERTVESHLYSSFAKLGITERRQLEEALKETDRM